MSPAPPHQFLERAIEGLQVLMEVEHLVAADRPLLRRLRQAIGMLGLIQQQHHHQAYAAVGAGHLDRAVTIALIEQADLAAGECLGAGKALVILGALFDQGDQIH